MTSMLTLLVAFAGVILVLALAAGAVQEIIKVIFAVRAHTTKGALESLVREAANVCTKNAADGQALVDEVVQKLHRLGQTGVREGKIRLDSIEATQLKSLIENVDPARVPGIKPPGEDAGEKTLERIGEQAKELFPLSMNAVQQRYQRRMRGTALLSSAVIVLALNADALGIIEQLRADPAYSACLASALGPLGAVRDQPSALPDQPEEPSADLVDTTTDLLVPLESETGAAAQREAPPDLETAVDALLSCTEGQEFGLLAGGVTAWRPGQAQWWIGIIMSILLVSLGAPFWHDTLGAIFGLKNRLSLIPSKNREGNETQR